ncbi:glycosyltransferase [Paraglaciecola sp. 2405UD69-4]|uniref:glycosyltransferase n=1 Tax=Paraglaciecola sp. 2405UD69-4 TaxID=3391836 RepID=UPI0039C8C4F7
MVKEVLIVQRILPSYRVPVFGGISNLTDSNVTIFAEGASADYGDNEYQGVKFNFVKAKWKTYLSTFVFDKNILKYFKSNDIVFHVADFKFLSLWLILFLNIFSNKEIFLHGQGGYKRSGVLVRLIYSLGVYLSDGYICYTNYSKIELLKKIPRSQHYKVSVCENTLVIDPVSEVLANATEPSIFYIGRLRQGCDIGILLDAAISAGVHVKVIGLGDVDYMEELKRKYSDVATFYGPVFDEMKQRDIAKSCIAGAYGGDAGLSVVHYMALGLPVIVHSDIGHHMGPEPSYVQDGINGLLFERKSVESLTRKILLLVNDDKYRYKLALEALATFNNLSRPSMSEKFCKIMRLT